MTILRLGNPAAVSYEPNPDGDEPVRLGVLDSEQVTTITTSPDSTLLQTIDEVLRCWSIHSDAAQPSWIECDDPTLLSVLTDTWDGIEVRDPERGSARLMGALGALLFSMAVWMGVVMLLRTDAGRDHQSRVSFDTSSSGASTYAAANYVGVTEDATGPASGDTTLTSELAVEGFTRAQGIYAHTTGTGTTTISKTFTMSGGTSRTLRHAGLFNASSSGTMAYKTAIPSAPTLVSGDSMAVTWTFTL